MLLINTVSTWTFLLVAFITTTALARSSKSQSPLIISRSQTDYHHHYPLRGLDALDEKSPVVLDKKRALPPQPQPEQDQQQQQQQQHHHPHQSSNNAPYTVISNVKRSTTSGCSTTKNAGPNLCDTAALVGTTPPSPTSSSPSPPLQLIGLSPSAISPSASSSPSSSASAILNRISKPTSTPNLQRLFQSAQINDVSGDFVAGTILVVAGSEASADVARVPLNGYGIRSATTIVSAPSGPFPVLSSNGQKNGYIGGIVVISEGKGQVPTGLGPEGWQTLFEYQVQFGVRIVRLDAIPTAEFGVSGLNGAPVGCCDPDVPATIALSSLTSIPNVGFKPGAAVSIKGVWHYPAVITNPAIAQEFAIFPPAPGSIAQQQTTAAVINSFPDRQQLVFFTSHAIAWNTGTVYIAHAWIQWVTRGLYSGFRRTYFSTQIDDVFLPSKIYLEKAGIFRLVPEDLHNHAIWTRSINSRLPVGSDFIIELGHNGNGVVMAANQQPDGPQTCEGRGPVFYAGPQTILPDSEFVKPVGSGTDIWPPNPDAFNWSLDCLKVDPLTNWLIEPANRDMFAHISHTFTHEFLNSATYSDAFKETKFNIDFFRVTALSDAPKFSKRGLIPPSISGVHNGDVLRAWSENGYTHCVGDNSRSVLVNPYSKHWPLISNMTNNGFEGYTIIPRQVTNIYFNCDSLECVMQQWKDRTANPGGPDVLMSLERDVTVHKLLTLSHDPYMFHQANMRVFDAAPISVGEISGQLSLLQLWTETVMREFTRLVDWPVITLTQDELVEKFLARMGVDQCDSVMYMRLTPDKKALSSVVLGSATNTCKYPIPITFPGAVASIPGGTRVEKVGSDPLTLWVPLNGSPVEIVLVNPIPLL